MNKYSDYLFRSPLLEDYNDDEYIDPTPIYYNEEYNCFVDDYGNIYVLDEGWSDFKEELKKYGKKKLGRFLYDWKTNTGRNLSKYGMAIAGSLINPALAIPGYVAGDFLWNKYGEKIDKKKRKLSQVSDDPEEEKYYEKHAYKESYGLSAFDETDEYSSQSLGTGLGKAFDTGNKLWNININNFDQTFDSDFIGPGDEYSNKANLPALRAAAITGGRPHPGTISNGINGKSSSKPFRLKELRDDFGQNG